MEFRKIKRSKLINPDQTEVLFEQVTHGVPVGFSVKADAAGVWFEGNSITFSTPIEFQELAKVIGDASKEHLALKRAVREKLI